MFFANLVFLSHLKRRNEKNMFLFWNWNWWTFEHILAFFQRYAYDKNEVHEVRQVPTTMSLEYTHDFIL